MLDREQLELPASRVWSISTTRKLWWRPTGGPENNGFDLHIKHLDLEAGKMEVEGLLAALEYTQGPGARARAFGPALSLGLPRGGR